MRYALLCLLLVTASPAFADSLTSADIITMARTGTPAEQIIARIHDAQTVHFTLDATTLAALDTAGATGDVLRAMIEATRRGTRPADARQNTPDREPDLLRAKRECDTLFSPSICRQSPGALIIPDTYVWRTTDQVGAFLDDLYIYRTFLRWHTAGITVQWTEISGVCVDRGPLRSVFYVTTNTGAMMFGVNKDRAQIFAFLKRLFDATGIPENHTCVE